MVGLMVRVSIHPGSMEQDLPGASEPPRSPLRTDLRVALRRHHPTAMHLGGGSVEPALNGGMVVFPRPTWNESREGLFGWFCLKTSHWCFFPRVIHPFCKAAQPSFMSTHEPSTALSFDSSLLRQHGRVFPSDLRLVVGPSTASQAPLGPLRLR